MDKIYITTPIYYVNDVPHLGHAYTTIAADVLARYWRKKLGRENVYFQTGADEHGQKIVVAAEKAGLTAKKYVDKIAPRFEKAWEILNIDYDFFIRTTMREHEKIVGEILEKIYKKGDIYKAKYKGLYCVPEERFLTQEELVDDHCPFHPFALPVEQEEENYFFRLEKYAGKISDLIKKDEIEIFPKERKNEILGKLKLGIKDISISRQEVKWGIPIPWDMSQTVYVWFDALLNYYSGLEIRKKEKFWPPDIQLMAKDILWFHAVIWPAMLLSLGFPFPKKIVAHGFFTVNGEKMSKSVGNVIDPLEIAKKYGTDALRYFLLSEFPFGQDGDVNLANLERKYTADLANGLGNLLQRVLTLITKNDIKIPNGMAPSCAEADAYLEELKFKESLGSIWKVIIEANQFLEQKEPWKIKDKAVLVEVLTSAYRRLETAASALETFMPETAEKIKNQLKTLKPEPLFLRL